MTKTRIADNVAWHLHQEVKKIKKERKEKGLNKNVPGDKRVDVKFNEWAKRNGIDLNDLKLMEKKK